MAIDLTTSVAVVGAGIAGLQALRSCLARDLDVVCFDAEDGPGGQWHENYSGLHLQVPKEMYEFPDLKNKVVKWGDTPSCAQLDQHCKDYVQNFHLLKHIRFSTEVLSISVGKRRQWKLKLRGVSKYSRACGQSFTFQPFAETGDEFENEFDYVIVATGPFSHRVPFIPKVAGMDSFKGTILHSSTNIGEHANKEMGKKVIVVGGAKSAHDQAVLACRNSASNVIQLMRRAHWGVPRFVMGLIPFEYLFCSRFGEALVHTCQGSCAPPLRWSRWRRCLNTMLRPIACSMIKSVEYLTIFQESLYGAMRPNVNMVQDVNGYGYVHTAGHAKFRREGKLDAKIGEIVSYTETGVNVREGDGITFYDCDMVIYGTGFRKHYNLFHPDLRDKLGNTSNGLCLYRQILHPELPQLAFVGSEFNTFTNMTSSALQAEWVARWAAGDNGHAFRASKEMMWAQIQEKMVWKKRVMEATYNANNIDFQQINYGDMLLADMGEPRWRKWPNLFREFLMPYRSADYDGVVGRPLKNKSTPFGERSVLSGFKETKEENKEVTQTEGGIEKPVKVQH